MLQYIGDIILWGNKLQGKVFEKRRIIQIILKAISAVKKSMVNEPAQEIQILELKEQG